jgi:RHS repeat-associated protein
MLSGAQTGTTNFTACISPYLIVGNGGNYTKHIYMGGQRITSKVSNSEIFSASPVTTNDLQAKYTALTAKIKERFDSLGVTYKGTPQSGGLISSSPSGVGGSYFYHSDHLGSSSLITDQAGAIVQHLEYVPFGETFIDERRSASSWTTPYQFSGKERDEETGLLYFGARYQDSKYGIWYSVDPLAEKYPNISSYVYCLDNPVKYVDPDGRKPTLENVGRNTNYGVMFVCPNNLNDAAFVKDYLRAKELNLPILRIDNIDDFKEGMALLKQKGTNVNAYFISQHGAPGSATIGDEDVDKTTDFSPLKNGLSGKNVILAQCDVTKGDLGIDLIQKFSNETNSNVASSDHQVISGKITNEKLNSHEGVKVFGQYITLPWQSKGEGSISNDFHLAQPNKPAKQIYDLQVKSNGTLIWNKKDNN